MSFELKQSRSAASVFFEVSNASASFSGAQGNCRAELKRRKVNVASTSLADDSNMDAAQFTT